MDDGLEARRGTVLAHVGAIIVLMQTTEQVIGMALAMVVPDAGRPSLETLRSDLAAHAKFPLGPLIKKVKARFGLDTDFEEVLAAFLEDRNRLVHRLDQVPGWNLHTTSGLNAAENFLSNLAENALFVTNAFTSLLVEWSDDTGLGKAAIGPLRKILGDLDGIANSVFTPKTQPL